MRRNRLAWAVVLVAASAVAGGCANTDHTGHARHSDVLGMQCPKCETVWIGPHQLGPGGGAKAQPLHYDRERVCPDCDVMARSYFEGGGKVLHDCPTCKVTPRVIRPVTPTHPKGTHI